MYALKNNILKYKLDQFILHKKKLFIGLGFMTSLNIYSYFINSEILIY